MTYRARTGPNRPGRPGRRSTSPTRSSRRWTRRAQTRAARGDARAGLGCGWGTFALHAARQYGAQVVGVTSPRAAAYAQKRMADEGVAEFVDIRVQDLRDVTDGPFDAISSIGWPHVGAAMLPVYTPTCSALLRPEGRLLNHAISRAGAPVGVSKTSSSTATFFPDGELVRSECDGRGAGGCRLRGARRGVVAGDTP